MSKLIIAIAVLLSLFALLRIGITFVSRTTAIGGIQSVNDNEQLGDCSKKPNCQGSQSSRINQKVDALPIALGTSDAMSTLASAITELGGKIEQQQGNYLHATFKTTLMGYTDDVELLVDVAASEVQIRSASRLGHSDLGANKKRIDTIRQHLTNRL